MAEPDSPPQGNANRDKPHFYLTDPNVSVFAFSPKNAPITKKLAPQGQRAAHAQNIKAQLESAVAQGLASLAQVDATLLETNKGGFYLEIRLKEALGFIEGLENATKNITIKHINVLDPLAGIVSVVVYVPERHVSHYQAIVDRYAAKADGKSPTPVDEAIAHIDRVTHALFNELYTDHKDKLPPADQVIWWEVWVELDDRTHAAAIFETLGLEFQSRVMLFAENCIYHVKASQLDLTRIITATDLIAEIRLPQKEPGFFLAVLTPQEQAQWIAALLKRRTVVNDPKVRICLLDSGVNHKHPLLEGILADNHADAHQQAWGTDDRRNHGTPMASVALYGDLHSHLAGNQGLEIAHGLISIKVLPEADHPPNEPEFYGLIIEESIYRADAIEGTSTKIICYAITHPEERRRGGRASPRPTSIS